LKRVLLSTTLLFIAVPAFAQGAPAPAAATGVSTSRAVWEIMSNYFTKSAEQVPEADYAYKPVETVRSFGQLVGHVAGAQNMFCAAALGEAQKSEDDIEKTATTKAALVAALKASNEYCKRAYAITDAQAAGMTKLFGSDNSKMFTLMLNASHVGEHYGNAVTYMRMKNMVPPSSAPRAGQ
jgi:uncharacterized damage-inducible protein DinB